MGGVLWHFDHLTGRSVRGQQVLTLGLVTESAFLPLDQDIFISTKQVRPQEFEDNRSTAARRYKQAKDLIKPELLALAVKRAIRNGFEADYLLADAWFGNKPKAGKHDWALFLSTDSELSPQKILEIYALRWGIDVYFKVGKQNLGLLKK